MTNETIYNKEINSNNDYKVSLIDFMDWLYKNESADQAFAETIKKFVKNGFTIDELYYLAVDYSIPIVMVKWFIYNI